MLALIMVGISCMLVTAMLWQLRKFGEVTYEQILFHMNISLDSETRLVESFLQNTVMVTAIILTVLYLAFGVRWKRGAYWQAVQERVRRYQNKVAGLVLLGSVIFVAVRLDIGEIIEDYRARSVVSDFYEKYYRAPQEVELKAPAKKRNLVLIFLESAEATFLRKEYRKKFKVAFMPELHDLAAHNLNFSNDEDIGGSMQVDGAQWTQAGLVAQTCGVPLHLPITNHNKFLPKHGYLPKAWCLFDILDNQGYEQTFMTGMESTYAGVDKFFESHGQPEILSWEDWKAKFDLDDRHDPIRKRILRDEQLYAQAKEEITRLAESGKPFAFTMMTMDTHGGNEFLDEENCSAVYGERHQNVYRCASKKIGSFVSWLQKQPFYKDTTIVIVNDHLVMNDALFAEGMARRNLNIFINSARQPSHQRLKNRRFTSFDMYPTIVESLGFDVAGDRLGLGVSLYGGNLTLPEQGYDTYEKLDNELSKRSRIYEQLLYGRILD